MKSNLDPDNLSIPYNVGRALAYMERAMQPKDLPTSLMLYSHNYAVFHQHAVKFDKMMRASLYMGLYREYQEILSRIKPYGILRMEEVQEISAGMILQRAEKNWTVIHRDRPCDRINDL